MAAGGTDMTMAIRITAAGNQALAVIGQVNRAVKTTGDLGGRMTRTIGGTGRVIGSMFSAALAPAKMLTTAALGLSLVFGGLSVKALGASGDMESLRLRMEGVTESVSAANRIFAETEQLSIKSPFTPQELVDARIGLINIGQTGREAMISVGDAASITQKPLGDLVSILASMETEPLRRIGIELKRESGTFSFAFRDRMQNMRTIVANGVDEARESLLSIFDIKYGGGMAKFASAWQGLTSTLQGNLALAAARFGDGLMPTAKRFVDGLNLRLAGLIEGGKLTEWGERVGEIISGAWDRAEAVIGFAGDVAANLSKTPASMGEGLIMVMQTGGQILAVSFANYLSGMSQIFVALAKMMSAAFLEDILQIKGMGWKRETMVRERLAEMTPQDARDAGINPDFAGRQSMLLSPERAAQLERKRDSFISGMSPQDQAEFATSGRGKNLENAASSIPEIMARIASETAGANKEMLRTLEQDLLSLAGGGSQIATVGERIEQARNNRLAAEAAARREEQYKQTAGLRTVTLSTLPMKDELGVGGNQGAVRRTYNMSAEQAGSIKAGHQLPDGRIVINIGEMTVRAYDANSAADSMVAGAGLPPAPAGGAH